MKPIMFDIIIPRYWLVKIELTKHGVRNVRNFSFFRKQASRTYAHADCRHSPTLCYLVYVKYVAMRGIERSFVGHLHTYSTRRA